MGNLNNRESAYPGSSVASERLIDEHAKNSNFGNHPKQNRENLQGPSPFESREAAFDAPVLD